MRALVAKYEESVESEQRAFFADRLPLVENSQAPSALPGVTPPGHRVGHVPMQLQPRGPSHRAYKCLYCPFHAPDRDALREHVRFHRAVSGAGECDGGAKFNRTHCCDLCDFCSPTTAQLESHRALHFVLLGPNRAVRRSSPFPVS